MKILLLSKSSMERKLVYNQLREHYHEVDVVKGGLSAISAMGAHSYDFLLAIDSEDDVYDAKYIIDFAEKHRIPSLLIQGNGTDILCELPQEIAPQTYASDTQVVAAKCASTLSRVSALVDTTAEHWGRSWGPPKATHAH